MATQIFGNGYEQYTPQEQARIAVGREVAQEGMVLLENNRSLPLADGCRTALFGSGPDRFSPRRLRFRAPPLPTMW